MHEQLHPLPRGLVRVHRVARAEDKVAQPGPEHEAVRVAVACAAHRLDAVDGGERDRAWLGSGLGLGFGLEFGSGFALGFGCGCGCG